MDTPMVLITSFVAILVVALVIFGLMGGVRRLGKKKGLSRLRIVDSVALDTKRRLVWIARDDVEHLLLIGGSQDLVVEASIPSATPPATADFSDDLTFPTLEGKD